MAPSWIRTANDLPKASSPQPSKCSISSRWPVDDTGRYSVRPSTMPSTAALIRSIYAALRPNAAALRASNCMSCSGGNCALAAGDMEASAFDAKAPVRQRKNDGNSSAICATAAPFYSATIDSHRARPRRAYPDVMLTLFPSPALSAFALRAPDPRRIRHRGAAGGGALLGTAGRIPVAQSGGGTAGAGSRGRTADSRRRRSSPNTSRRPITARTARIACCRRSPADASKCAGWRTGSTTNSMRKLAARW